MISFAKHALRWFSCCVALVTPGLVSGDDGLALTGAAKSSESQVREANLKHFTAVVLPLLRDNCLDCHSHDSGEAGGGLLLDSLAAIRSGGTRGSAVTPGDVEASPLVRAIEYQDGDLQMPPDSQLSEEEIGAVRAWVAAGADVPQSFMGTTVEKPSQQDLATDHWAYQPLKPDAALADAATTRAETSVNFIDAIISRGLSANGLKASPPADHFTFLRRLSYDLSGLPPSYEEQESFRQQPLELAARSAAAERYLASPQFGERWARHWMDVARYSDNKGYVFQEDREYPEAYRYRDWLINAFNRDLPYDEFIKRQLAADMLPDATEADLPALGFLTLGRRFLNNKFDIADDRIDVVSRGLMGMTLACARCHDHKYDPLTQQDYYALAGVFFSTEEPGGEPWLHRLVDKAEPQDTHVLLRGVPGNRGNKVSRRFVSFLAPDEKPFEIGSGRLELAEHIAAPDNPLTARVIANRVWMHLMGQPLVDTPSDFGLRCPPPEQLQLLDALASHLIAEKFSLKRLIYAIVTSEIYAQQSRRIAEQQAIDPTNKWYWRMNRKRLGFEALRDTLTSVTGQLRMDLYGKAVPIGRSDGDYRRAVYAYIDRQNLPSVFRTFDLASPDAHVPRRPQTSVPQQGLYLLNSEFTSDLARRMASHPHLAAADTTDPHAVQWLVQRLLSRDPSPSELDAAIEFLRCVESPVGALVQEQWTCGFGEFDPEEKRLKSFRALPHFTGVRWQGGPELPDAQTGWCMLSAEGGHPGNDLGHAVVRRWIAPRDGKIHIGGKLKHTSDMGDGVRASMLLGKLSLGGWVVHNSDTRTQVKKVEVNAGEAIDFVVDCQTGPSYDSFDWTIRLGYSDGEKEQFRSESGFPAPQPQPLNRWAVLIQALLSTNELAFVD